jgi:hypothetical protein
MRGKEGEALSSLNVKVSMSYIILSLTLPAAPLIRLMKRDLEFSRGGNISVYGTSRLLSRLETRPLPVDTVGLSFWLRLLVDYITGIKRLD